MATRGAGRTRNYATVVYPESAPEGWQAILERLCIPAFVSPIHDNDKNPTGEDKKPHYHVMIMYDGVKTVEQALEVFNQIGGVGCEKVENLRGYARYLCHLDNPDKAQYSIDDVHCVAGADYISIIGLAQDRYKTIGEIMDFCADNYVTNFAELMDYARRHRYDWYRVLCDSGTYVVKEYMKSLGYKLEKEARDRFKECDGDLDQE